jgi:hypothetical protein
VKLVKKKSLDDSEYTIASILRERGRSNKNDKADRRRLDTHAKVMTQNEFREAIRNRKMKRKRTKANAKS